MKRFLIAMASAATLTILGIHPIFAQVAGGYRGEVSSARESAPEVPPLGESWNVGPYSNSDPALGESWDVGPYSPADSALAPAPQEPMESGSAPMFGGYTPVRPISPSEPWIVPPESRYAQPFVNPSMPASPMHELPPVGMPPGGLYKPFH